MWPLIFLYKYLETNNMLGNNKIIYTKYPNSNPFLNQNIELITGIFIDNYSPSIIINLVVFTIVMVKIFVYSYDQQISLARIIVLYKFNITQNR